MDTIRSVFIGVGGQGNLLASRLLGESALQSGIPVTVSEIHGMAQRGGIVESAVILGELTSPIVSDGEADVLIGFEPLETLRALKKCNKNTLIIMNSNPLPPFTVAIGQGKYPETDKMIEKIKSKVESVMIFNGTKLAEKAGNVLSLNMVMLGALIGSGITPISTEAMKETIFSSTKKAFVDTNIKAFELGMDEAKRFKNS